MSKPRPLSARRWLALTTVVLVAAGGSLAACAKKAAKGTAQVKVSLKPEGCPPPSSKLEAGPVTFKVTNDGASKVSELEVLQHNTIIGEKENLTPGLSGNIPLNMKPGDYQFYCPGAKQERFKLTVTGKVPKATGTPAERAALRKAVTDYRTYVEQQVSQLYTNVQALAAASKGGDIEGAKARYPAGRLNYERIEPIAESFGAGGVLDLHIDGRIDDYDNPAEFRGFHRLEKALWQDKSLAGMGLIADQLVADVKQLVDYVPTIKLDAVQIANGATELLNEAGNSKITGEEERYSHLDLLDMAGNVQGAQEAFTVLDPALKTINPSLSKRVGRAFTEMQSDLEQYKRGDGYVDYATLKAQPGAVSKLSRELNAVAEPLSKVGSEVSGV